MSGVAGLFRRIANMLAIGRTRVAPVESGTIAKVQASLGGLQTRDGTPIFQSFGFASSLPINTDVVFVCISGDTSNGVIIASNHQSFRPKGMKAGEAMIYDNLGQSIYLSQAGIVINGGGLPITIQNTPLVTIDSDLDVTGTVTATVDVVANGTSVHTHRHGGVSAGAANTGLPV